MVRLRRLAHHRGQFVRAGDDADPQAARVEQVHGRPAERLGQRVRPGAGGVGQPQQVAGPGGAEGGAEKP
ncbi:hypothetical protein AQJ67_20510 [Streptomyces caeruleatus]|uniref:Uncharacterized protein n=1 Tax=Streptomyces caeruleatus TaxID=661399 RepID=A0A117RPX4_9ACTN|nr:hypothetical protein AQJ67_20510 [Streptomyces caeruleatus]